MHPRVLIVGTVPYNRQTSARAFESYFKNWEKENLAQVFSNPREPVKGHCGELYQITDKMMLKRYIIRNTQVGRIYHYEELADEWKPQSEKERKSIIAKLYTLGSKKSPLNYLMRGMLWRKKFWCTPELNQWMDKFAPQCVFLAFSDDYFIPQIALYAAQKYNIPIVSCIGDDYYFNEKASVSPLYHLYRKTYKRLIDRVFAHGGSAAYIGDKIRDKYNGEFGLDGETVYLTSEMQRHEYREINTVNPLISYAGNIRLGRSASLLMIASALGEINKDYKIQVYSNESDPVYYKALSEHPNVDYHGAVPYSKVKEIMQTSDLLLVVEGFAAEDVRITRYSLSTKVADSLAVGGFVFTVGSEECGAIEYLKSIDCGPVCTAKDEIKTKLERLLFDTKFQAKLYERCRVTTEKNHTLCNSNQIFEGIVDKAISRYQRGERTNVR